MHNYFTLEFTIIIQYQDILDILENTNSKAISYRAFESFLGFYYFSFLLVFKVSISI